MVLLSTHNICFSWEIRLLFFQLCTLSKACQMGESLKIPKFWTLFKLAGCLQKLIISCLNAKICFYMIWKLIKEAIIISLIQHFEADFLWKVSLKILNSGLILKTSTHGLLQSIITKRVQMIGLFQYQSYCNQSYCYLPNSAFWGCLYMESQPQNPEFRINPENFHPWIITIDYR